MLKIVGIFCLGAIVGAVAVVSIGFPFNVLFCN